VEVFLHGFPLPGESERLAAEAEADGWDGLLLADSQNLQAEVFVELAFAARSTERLKLGTGVTNPLTRHPAVVAAAAATLQSESGGRIVLGVGRGDSSVTFVGERPASLAVLEDFVRRLQAYLRGDAVDANGFASRLQWLPPGETKVPVDVVATGAGTIGVGARTGDAVTFSVGAEPARLRWAVETARAAGASRFGAYVIVAPHAETAVARDLVRANVGIFAHFSRASLGRLGTDDRRVVEAVTRRYDTERHAESQSTQTTAVPDDFVDRFAVVGPSNGCVARLRELAALGIERLVVVGAAKDASRRQAEAVRKRFATEVLPELRAS
jgi:5,10-methylenetetrahydromethanopterin reductase